MYLLTLNLFNDAVSNSDYTMSNVSTVMNKLIRDDVERSGSEQI
jgi:hypothetical protein